MWRHRAAPKRSTEEHEYPSCPGLEARTAAPLNMVPQPRSCWGGNGSGELGTTTDLLSPTPAPDLKGDARFVFGFDHTCRIKKDAALECWGLDIAGQLGDGTTTDRLAPTAVQNLMGVAQSCARTVPHVRAQGRWHGRMLGLEYERTAWRRHDREPHDSDARRGPHGRHRHRARVRSHVRTQKRRHRRLLGR